MRVGSMALAAGLVLAGAAAQAADQPLLGIVSISANEANNARYIAGATAAAKEDGWQVSVIDAAGSADQANAAIQNFAGRGAGPSSTWYFLGHPSARASPPPKMPVCQS